MSFSKEPNEEPRMTALANMPGKQRDVIKKDGVLS